MQKKAKKVAPPSPPQELSGEEELIQQAVSKKIQYYLELPWLIYFEEFPEPDADGCNVLLKLPELKDYGIALRAKTSLEALEALRQVLPEFFYVVVMSEEPIPEPPAFLSKGLENKYFVNARVYNSENDILRF